VGESGADPGQFNIVHNIVTDKDGWVYVADRENNRVQVFDRQRQIRNSMEQHASALRALHGHD
jgi:DNA-binding beta-propeller fold protein YncE